MKLTKFQHACFVVKNNNTTLVFDPGIFSKDFIIPDKVDGIVVSHEHPDHLDEKLIAAIFAKHPNTPIIGHESVVGKFTNHPSVTAKVGEICKIGDIELEFFGGEHAEIIPSLPVPANLGVLVNGLLYYPGDSFILPERPIKLLALPVAAPWLKISDTLAFLQAVKPEITFPTHDAILSEEGLALVDRLVGTAAAGQGIHYQRLSAETVTI